MWGTHGSFSELSKKIWTHTIHYFEKGNNLFNQLKSVWRTSHVKFGYILKSMGPSWNEKNLFDNECGKLSFWRYAKLIFYKNLFFGVKYLNCCTINIVLQIYLSRLFKVWQKWFLNLYRNNIFINWRQRNISVIKCANV